MNACPNCGAQSISRWQRLRHVRGQSRFRCPACNHWLAFRPGTTKPAWYAKHLLSVPGLLLAPAFLALALFFLGLLITAFVSRLTEAGAIAFILVVLFGALGADMVRYRSAAKTAQLVVADYQEGSPAFDAARRMRQMWTEPGARLGVLRMVTFFILLLSYLWLIGALMRWLKHAA